MDVPTNPILPPPPVAIAPSSADATATIFAQPVASVTAALRRGYGPVDMKLSPCVTLENDHTLTGKQCQSGAIVFGPYVSAPADADVDVAFELESRGTLVLGADIVSRSAQQFHGSLLEQTIEPGPKRVFGYRVHLFNGVSGLESRIFVRAAGPVDFRITDLTVTVR